MIRFVFAMFTSVVALVFVVPCAGLLADQAAISIDGEFSDWAQTTQAYIDNPNDSPADDVDFGAVWIADDSRFLFLRIQFGVEFDSNENNDVRVYIDTDSNSKTGLPIADLGAELEWRLGFRSGFFHVNGSLPISAANIRFRGGPTVTSTEFEFAIGRDTMPDGINELFANSHVRIAIIDHAGADRVPDIGETIVYQFDQGSEPPDSAISLDRYSESDLRMVTHNVLFDSPWDPNIEPMFGRQWMAVAPDVLNLQEIYDHSPRETAQLVTNWVPLDAGDSWYAAGNSDCVTVSRFPILEFWPLDGNLAVLLDTTGVLGTEMLIVNAHLPCCDNEGQRQLEIDRIMSFVRDAKSVGGDVTVTPNTPVVITGDLNLVGLAQQLTSLISGDIVSPQFGADFSPDWDETRFTSVVSRQTEKRMGYTWRSDFSSFWPGQLDFVIFSDSVMQLRNHYILYTPEISAPQKYALQPGDSAASDHLLFCTDFTCPPDVLLGDVNLDGAINLLDVGPFVNLLSSGKFQAEGDLNEDGAVNLLDVDQFVLLLSGG